MKRKFDAAEILRALGEIRRAMPKPSVPLPASDRASTSRGREAVDLFEEDAIEEALDTMCAELSAALDEKEAKLMQKLLEVYWVSEELARDPANAKLIPHVEAMRTAYEQAYGTAIPPRPAK